MSPLAHGQPVQVTRRRLVEHDKIASLAARQGDVGLGWDGSIVVAY